MKNNEKKILVVEDEAHLAKGLKFNLEREGYLVTLVDNGQSAVEILSKESFDLMILDIMLPKLTGLEVARRIRNTDMRFPILMLSAKSADEDRELGLAAGADDYLAKPFEPQELLLRINSILRRITRQQEVVELPLFFTLGKITYDTIRAELWSGDTLIRLTTTEIALMRIFSANVGEPISREKLVEDLGRGKGQAQERAVDVQVTRLRRKIEVDSKQPRYIQTVRGSGYMLAPD